MQAEFIHLSILEATQKSWAGFPFLCGISWMEACAAHVHGEPETSDLHVCVKLGENWNCSTRAVSSACARAKSHWCEICIQSERLTLSGAACKDLDKGRESLHPTWRKSPNGESKCVWDTWTVQLLLLFGQEFLWSQSDRLHLKRSSFF